MLQLNSAKQFRGKQVEFEAKRQSVSNVSNQYYTDNKISFNIPISQVTRKVKFMEVITGDH